MLNKDGVLLAPDPPRYRSNIVIPRINRSEISEGDRESGIVPLHAISQLVLDTHKTLVWFPETKYEGVVYKPRAFLEEPERYVPILWMHGGDLFRWTLPIGAMEGDWQIEGDGKSPQTVWKAKSRFHIADTSSDSVNARNIYSSIIEGFLRMFSIGFDAEKALVGEKEVNAFLETMGRKERYPRPRAVYLGIILYEYSVVTWGANPGAHVKEELTAAQVRSAISKDYVPRLEFEQLKSDFEAYKESVSQEATGRSARRSPLDIAFGE